MGQPSSCENRDMRILIFIILADYVNVSNGFPHIIEDAPKPDTPEQEHCQLAETCFHDTIPVCGEYRDKTRTFLDECDLYEYGCDTGHVHKHIDESPGCPDIIKI